MKDQETIYIIGAGAIGKSLAVCLENQGRNVILLRGSIDDRSDLIENIEVELNEGKSIKAKIRVSTTGNFATLKGIIVLTNKSYGNRQLAERLKGKTGDSPVVILQNGLHIEQPFIDNGFGEIYRCVLFITSQVLAAGKLRLRPVAVSPVGIIKGNSKNLGRIVKQLSVPHFEFKADENIQTVIWTKAIINSVFNSVCPLMETDNGIFHRNEKTLNIARRLIAGCVEVAKLNGILLNTGNVIENLLQISRFSDGQLISTYQDILEGRRTEIETLNLAIARIAGEYNVGHLVSETRLLGELVQIKSELAQSRRRRMHRTLGL